VYQNLFECWPGPQIESQGGEKYFKGGQRRLGERQNILIIIKNNNSENFRGQIAARGALIP